MNRKADHDVEFTSLGGRYSTDADTYRILLEARDGPFEAPIILAGLQNKKIKEVRNEELLYTTEDAGDH